MIPKVSIIIRAYNEQRHIESLLIGIRKQKASFPYEVILVDSGSTDETVNIAQRFGVSIIPINPEDFTFGYSLNMGIDQAQGEFCVFISAHCYPSTDCWLEYLIRSFDDESVAVVYGKQRGGRLNKFSENQIFLKWFPDEGGGYQKFPFCNNANTAIRKRLWFDYKYNEKITGLEDIDWANNALSKGYFVFYSTDAEVIHIHDESWSQIYNRYKREAIAIKDMYPLESFSFLEFIKLFFLNTLCDYIQAIKEGVFINNVMAIPIHRYVQFWATYNGYHLKKPILGTLKQKLYYPRSTFIINTENKERRYDGIICGDDRITTRVLDKAKRLKLIVKWGTSIDSIDKQ